MMASARDKVVRVEEVHYAQLTEEQHTLQTPEQDKNNSNKALELVLAAGDDLHDEEEEEETNGSLDDIASEAKERVLVLPEGWPKLPQIFQQQSWSFSTTMAPSVNKATAHLELLQTTIEQWQEMDEQESKTRVTSSQRRSRKGAYPSGKTVSRQALQFELPMASTTQLSLTSTSQEMSEQSDLSVTGYGAKPSTADSEVLYLGADEVIEEVVVLLARLEYDRQTMLEQLDKERKRIIQLRAKIDSLAEQRLANLAPAVQHEHNSCAQDIYDLNVLCVNHSRIEQKISSKLAMAKALNAKTKETIAFIKGHIPLVQEKLDLELEAMSRIFQAQQDTDHELEITTVRCSKIEAKYDEAQTKAEEERAMIQRDLAAARKELEDVTDSLAMAKKTHEAYLLMISSAEEKIITNAQDLKVLEVKLENCRTADSMAAARVKDLQTQIVKEEFEHQKLTNSNSSLTLEIESKLASYEHTEMDLQRAQEILEEKHRKLSLLIKELELDIEDATKKIEDCINQEIADRKNMARLKREIKKTQEQLASVMDELCEVTIVHTAKQDEVHAMEMKCRETEEALKATITELQRQMKEEQAMKVTIAAQIEEDTVTMEKSQKATGNKKEKVDAEAEQVKAQAAEMRSQVEKLRSRHAANKQAIEGLQSQMEQLANDHEALSSQCNGEINSLMPDHQTLTDKLGALTKQLDHIAWKTDLMTKSLEESEASSKMMAKSLKATKKINIELEADYAELQLKVAAGQKILNDLTDNKVALENRMRTAEKEHTELYSKREEEMRAHEEALARALKENTVLAAQYRTLLHQHMALKNRLLDTQNRHNILQNTYKDAKQLQGLQQHMHHSMRQQFQYTERFNASELSRLGTEGENSALDTGTLEDRLNGAVAHIAGFLRKQIDGDVIRKMAMEKVDREEKEELKRAELQGEESKREELQRVEPVLGPALVEPQAQSVPAHS